MMSKMHMSPIVWSAVLEQVPEKVEVRAGGVLRAKESFKIGIKEHGVERVIDISVGDDLMLVGGAA